jgi:hypothetical protein
MLLEDLFEFRGKEPAGHAVRVGHARRVHVRLTVETSNPPDC